jgi:cold shock protein
VRLSRVNLGGTAKAAGTDAERRQAQLVTGRILQFDQVRGYGFVAADDDGDDVFLHASVFDGDSDELVPGAKIEFKVMAGDRGRKAFAAHLTDDEPEHELVPPPRPVPGPRPAPAFPPAASSAPAPSPSPSPSPASEPAPAGIGPAPHAPGPDQVPDDEQMCDVLSPVEFGQELTELLLTDVPSLTGQQVLAVRQAVLESARKHGWVDM